VLLIGCDPKTDTSMRLLGGKIPETMINRLIEQRGLELSSLILETDSGVDVIEMGGPEPGMGCAGRGVTTLCQRLQKHEDQWRKYDVIIFDVLGDLVCGGFVAPLRFGWGNNVFIISSEETASLFAANNIARVVCQPYYDHLSVGGIIFNLRSAGAGQEMLAEFARRINIEVLATIQRDAEILNAEIEGRTAIEHAPESPIARTFHQLAANIEDSNRDPVRPGINPLSHEEFWGFIKQYRTTRR
jgi:nitrogenase iron protein NifH